MEMASEQLYADEAVQLGQSFARSMRARGLSDRTIDTYLEAVRQLASHSSPVITRDAIRDYIASRPSKGTASNRHRALLQFFKFVEDEDEGPNLMAGMKPPKVAAQPVEVVSDEEVAAMLASCKGKAFMDRRDAAIIRVLWDSGVRKAELLGMELEDLNLDDNVVLVHGKGGSDRMAPFGIKTAEALDRYLRVRVRHKHAADPALWISEKGPLRGTGLARIVRRRGQAAGIEGLHPHQLRHTWAHNWMAEGASEGDLMELAGWKGRDMLARYGKSAAAARAIAAHRRLGRGDRV